MLGEQFVELTFYGGRCHLLFSYHPHPRSEESDERINMTVTIPYPELRVGCRLADTRGIDHFEVIETRIPVVVMDQTVVLDGEEVYKERIEMEYLEVQKKIVGGLLFVEKQ